MAVTRTLRPLREPPRPPWLVFRALYEIARYEAIVWLRGSGCILRQLRLPATARETASRESEKAICEAVLLTQLTATRS